MPKKIAAKVGDTFNKLTIKKIFWKEAKLAKGQRRRFAVAECECGTIKECNLYHITSGRTVSCGCGRVRHGKCGTKEYFMFIEAKCRARDAGLPFDIEIDDIHIPEVCPLLGIPIETHHTKCNDRSPTLDKLIPSLGYVKGNILVISNRANRIKNNASIDEIMLLADNLHAILMK